MYAYIKGLCTELTAEKAIIEAGGIGYEIYVSSKSADKLRINEESKVYTYLHLAEGIQALYGFISTDEREMFRNLIGVTRVGPKLAITVLSYMTPQDIASAVITDTASAFDHVPGMGRKTAQRVILELKEKMKGYFPAQESGNAASPTAASIPSNIQMEAVEALTSLGYDGLTASKAVTQITDADSVESLITKALRKLAKQ